MKKAQFISALVAISVLASTTPAAALGLSTSVDADASLKTMIGNDRNDDKGKDNTNAQKQNDDASLRMNSSTSVKAQNDNRWNHWLFNAGISGTVTAVSGDTLTVRANNGTTYTVDGDEAKVRMAGNASGKIEKGDRVIVQGVVNGTNVVAALIIDASSETPTATDEEKRTGIVGTVTAKNSSSMTILARNGETYTVKTSGATVWKNKNESSSTANIDTGDSVVIQGSISANTVTAARVYVLNVPASSSDEGIRGTITAMTDTSITLLSNDGTTYTVRTDDAEYVDHRNKEEDRDEFRVGEMISIEGDVSGTTIDADTVAEVNGGFFYRFGQFWKHLFSKKSGEVNATSNASIR